LGDGIQALIILAYRLFTAKNGSWIFIEEPEQGLHPGLQRAFLDAVAKEQEIKDKKLKIFMTTHSSTPSRR
jgi:predicted ATP-dependent endonuclease of OLD family